MADTDVLDAIEKAIALIHVWHGDETWEIYFQHSPEMKSIRNCWKYLKESPTAINNNLQNEMLKFTTKWFHDQVEIDMWDCFREMHKERFGKPPTL